MPTWAVMATSTLPLIPQAPGAVPRRPATPCGWATPVVTQRGDRIGSRLTSAILEAVDHGEWIAYGEARFIDTVRALGEDREGRLALKSTLRDEMRRSPVCDAKGLARALEDACAEMHAQTMPETQTAPHPAQGTDAADSPLGPATTEETGFRLCLGGREAKPGWRIINIEPGPAVDEVGDIRNLSDYPTNSCAEIYASHVLEHVPQAEMVPTLQGFCRVLQPAGRFMVSVPDLDVLCRRFVDPNYTLTQKHHIMRMIFGGQTDEHDFHYIGLNFELLSKYLYTAGFKRVERVDGFGLFRDTSDFAPYGERISLNIVAYA